MKFINKTIVYFIFLLMLSALITPINSRSLSSYYRNKVHLVDNFSDNNYLKNPEWWEFDNIIVEMEKNHPKKKKYKDPKFKQKFVPSYIGENSIHITGKSKSWYIGGIGTYLGLNGHAFNAIKVVIKGNGPKSGILIFELYDDDNNNWEIERDATNDALTVYDDKFIHTLKVDWDDWRVVMIPIDQFSDDNPGVGDDIWNPNQKNGSGGLLQLQVIALGQKDVNTIDVNIDQIKFFNKKNLF